MEKFEGFDEELAGMVNYSDETVPAAMPVMEQKAKPKAAKQPEVQKNDVMDAQFIPFPTAPRGLIDRLYDMTKWLGICGSISMLLWWFQVNGMMDMEAAYPCILACAIIGGIGVGRSSK